MQLASVVSASMQVPQCAHHQTGSCSSARLTSTGSSVGSPQKRNQTHVSKRPKCKLQANCPNHFFLNAVSGNKPFVTFQLQASLFSLIPLPPPSLTQLPPAPPCPPPLSTLRSPLPPRRRRRRSRRVSPTMCQWIFLFQLLQEVEVTRSWYTVNLI